MQAAELDGREIVAYRAHPVPALESYMERMIYGSYTKNSLVQSTLGSVAS
jgi:hypothetical protein